ncbi:hypothetical protein EVAR_85885_1 [Eumeta japonica]|uniref:Uncharacterized protein n=1 Tax=Eumeta variegata TaxID=151549 RepID=A0A4C2A7B2_EUMVA|nr:hypothetical protein EVAR_85885_1 [Eumeta japonica]
MCSKVSENCYDPYRNPWMWHILNEIYSGIPHTGRDPIIDDGWLRHKQTSISSLPQTLYLAHTQAGKTAKSHGMRTSTQVELRRCATQKVQEWEQASCPSSPLEIEGSIPPHHLSPLKEANELLLKGKEALESAGNMKRECKSIAAECLQSLYDRARSFGPRSRHKYNLEAERTKHAQELVRIERAHNKDLTNVVKTLTEELSQAREDVRKSLDETKSIRDWLGYETEESKETNKDVKKRLLDIETSLREIKMEKSKTKVESVTLSTKKMETDIKTLSAQLDEFRTKWGALKNETSKTLETSNKTLHEIKNLPKQLSANEKVEEQLKAVQSAVQNVSERLNSARDPVVQIDLHEQLQPLQEKMEAMSSAMKTMRDKDSRHRQRREGISKENWRKLIKLTNPKPHTQKRLQNHQPTTESHVDSLPRTNPYGRTRPSNN